MKIKLLFTLFILSTCFSDLYSHISTDRPNQTESPFALPMGHIQIETGISIEDSQSNITTLFRIGIINGIEVRLKNNLKNYKKNIQIFHFIKYHHQKKMVLLIVIKFQRVG